MIKQPPRVSCQRLPRDLVIEYIAISAYRDLGMFPPQYFQVLSKDAGLAGGQHQQRHRISSKVRQGAIPRDNAFRHASTLYVS